jgi:hypothetical protein
VRWTRPKDPARDWGARDRRAVEAAALNLAAAAPRIGLDDIRGRFLPDLLKTADQIGTRSTWPTWILFASRSRLAAAIFSTVDPVARAIALTVSPRTTWCSW